MIVIQKQLWMKNRVNQVKFFSLVGTAAPYLLASLKGIYLLEEEKQKEHCILNSTICLC